MPKAQSVINVKQIRDDGSVVEVVVWAVPEPLAPCTHGFKYRLYFGKGGDCRVRYDNERGKGDHRHVMGVERAYVFTTLEALLADFELDVSTWRERNGNDKT